MNQLEQIKLPILADLVRFNEIFDNTLRHTNPLLHRVFQHILMRKGKLMRPTLLLLTAREYGQPTEATYLSAVMLELLHTASLVHDDVVDESDERRGQSAVHSDFGNNVAVLVGDWLLSSALEKAAETHNLRIVEHVAKLGKNLASGEIIQLSNTETDSLSEETYYDVIRLKTASLFIEAAMLGAISVDADDAGVQRMSRLGEIIGLCFQIKDDIFDYSANSDIGKPTGSDMAEGKLTLPALLALKSHGDDSLRALARKVKACNASKDDIARLVEFTKTSGGIDDSYTVMEQLTAQAKQLVADFQNTEIKRSLLSYIDFVSSRTL